MQVHYNFTTFIFNYLYSTHFYPRLVSAFRKLQSVVTHVSVRNYNSIDNSVYKSVYNCLQLVHKISTTCRQPADRTVMLNAFFFFPINPWSLNRLLALVEIEYSQPFESKQSHRVANIIARELFLSPPYIWIVFVFTGSPTHLLLSGLFRLCLAAFEQLLALSSNFLPFWGIFEQDIGLEREKVDNFIKKKADT